MTQKYLALPLLLIGLATGAACSSPALSSVSAAHSETEGQLGLGGSPNTPRGQGSATNSRAGQVRAAEVSPKTAF